MTEISGILPVVVLRGNAAPEHPAFRFAEAADRLDPGKTKKQTFVCHFVLVEISGIEPLTS